MLFVERDNVGVDGELVERDASAEQDAVARSRANTTGYSLMSMACVRSNSLRAERTRTTYTLWGSTPALPAGGTLSWRRFEYRGAG